MEIGYTPGMQQYAHPFLKWAGGKSQLLPELTERVAAAMPLAGYHEPFIGGGALFFELASREMLPARVCLSDANPNLIDAYLGVRDCVDDVVALLREHHARHCPDYYYAVRAAECNTQAERAARIIYLNRTCFNGLFRENSSGQFNVPCGRYANPRICDEPNLRACSTTLRRARIAVRSFEAVLDAANPGDFVYFDPPYHPLSKTSSFTSYDRYGFDEDAQRRLAGVFAELTRRNVRLLLSNSNTPFVLGLYQGFQTDVVYAKRSVNSRADGRGKIPELLIRNF